MFGKVWNISPLVRLGKTILVMLMCLSLVFSIFTPLAMADEVQSNTNMRHSPPDFFVPEHRIQMDARVTDRSGVELVRCYFKALGEADFVFVPMTNTGRNNYSGVLPAPSRSTQQIEYLFLVVNADNQVVKSQTFVIEQKDQDKVPAWQDMDKTGEIQVSMELDQIPDDLAGFSDNIAMNTVESSLRFGLVAGGLYQLTGGTAGAGASASAAGAGASVSGSAASAATAGTVTAGAAGVGTAGAVAAGVGAAAAVGGAAAAGGGGGGGGGSSSGGATANDFAGEWSGNLIFTAVHDPNDPDNETKYFTLDITESAGILIARIPNPDADEPGRVETISGSLSSGIWNFRITSNSTHPDCVNNFDVSGTGTLSSDKNSMTFNARGNFCGKEATVTGTLRR